MQRVVDIFESAKKKIDLEGGTASAFFFNMFRPFLNQGSLLDRDGYAQRA
jgi:hypothetical protein